MFGTVGWYSSGGPGSWRFGRWTTLRYTILYHSRIETAFRYVARGHSLVEIIEEMELELEKCQNDTRNRILGITTT